MLVNRNWFYTITATAVKRGLRFLTGDKPESATFKNLTDSVVFKTESGDRAKEDTVTSPQEISGHTVLATDTQAKTNAAQKNDRSLVVQPHQLPDVDTGDTYIDVTIDVVTTARNKFIVTISTFFQDLLTSIQSLLPPAGGNTGEGLVKLSNADGDYGWAPGVVDTLKVKVNLADTLAEFLEDKLVDSPSITFSTSGAPAKIQAALVPSFLMPVGGIIMWSGIIANIPAGWALCDGTGGTPPLQGMFIVGFDITNPDYDTVGNIGGLSTVTLGINQIPAHSHGGGSHTHSIPAYGTFGAGGGGTNVPFNTAISTATGSSGPIIATEGGGQSHENRPPYYTLAYIIKI